jgi:PAS domain S-box-containing protein
MKNLRLLRDLDLLFSNGLPLDDLLPLALERIAVFFDADTCAILVADGADLVVRASRGEGATLGTRVPVGDTFESRVMLSAEPVAIHDVESANVGSPPLTDARVRSIFGARMEVAGKPLGVLQAGSATPRAYSDEETLVLQLAADRIAAALEQATIVRVASVLSGKLGREKFVELGTPATRADYGDIFSAWHAGEAPYTSDDDPLVGAVAGPVVEEEEVRFRHANGEGGAGRASAGPIRDPSGAIVAPITSYVDVTERQRLEDALTKAGAISEQARRDLFSLFSEFPAPICVTRGPELVVELANTAYLKAWGKDESVLGKPLLEGLPELRGQGFDELLRGVMQTGIPHHGHGSLARLDRKHDGTLDEVYFDFVYSPLHGANGEIDRVVIFAIDVTRQVQADRSRAFLAQASAVLVSSLDYEKTLARLARLCVPTIADWAAIDVKQPDGTIGRLAVAHADPEKIELVRRIADRIPSRLDDDHGIGRVIRTSESEVFRRIPDDVIADTVRDPETLDAVRSLGLVSSICVPIRIDDAAIGALSLVTAESRREYLDSDVLLAEELALRAAGAIKNASLYSESLNAIRQQETRFQLLVESVTDYAIFMLDPTGHIASWNRGAERLKGYKADEILGKHFSVFYPRKEVEAGKCEHELDVAVQEGRFEEEGWRIRKDGSTFWANVTITATTRGACRASAK